VAQTILSATSTLARGKPLLMGRLAAASPSAGRQGCLRHEKQTAATVSSSPPFSHRSQSWDRYSCIAL
jgi:hypothetical protein